MVLPRAEPFLNLAKGTQRAGIPDQLYLAGSGTGTIRAASWAADRVLFLKTRLPFSCLLGREWSVTAEGRWPVFPSSLLPSQTTLSLLDRKEDIGGKLFARSGFLLLGSLVGSSWDSY